MSKYLFKFLISSLLFSVFSVAMAQNADQRADYIQDGIFSVFMSADESYYKHNSASDNNPYGYGYWPTAHALETLSEAFVRTRNVVYRDRMKKIIAGIRKYNLYGAGTYRNDYYDDLEWLALACLNSYRVTKDVEYLDAVHQIWDEIKTGYDGTKMSWKKGCNPACNNSIGNSPAIIIAVKLYQLEQDPANLQMAKNIHAWMKANVLNDKGGIWDAPNNKNEGWQFSYNSGMFIGACLELNLVTGNQSYVDDAIKASEFMMKYRLSEKGVFYLNETGQGDGGLFKGIFARYFTEFIRLGNLTAAQRDRYLRIINYTGSYVWENAVNKSNYICGPNWSVAPNGETIDVTTQISGVHLMESVASLNKVHVYQNINYSGFYSQLSVGSYTLAQLQARGVSDNDITSISIPKGVNVTVFENDNFSGPSKTFSSNTAWFNDWNDKISSIKIYSTNDVVSVYQNVNYDGYGVGLSTGDYTTAQLNSLGIKDNDLTSIKVGEGFKAIVYVDDNFQGNNITVTENQAWIGDVFNDKVSSIRIRPNGISNLQGIYYLKNSFSNLYVDLDQGKTNNGAKIQQWAYNGSDAQKFKFTHLGDGNYRITSLASNKVFDVKGISYDAGATLLQWDHVNGKNQHFILVDAGNGLVKMILEHTGMTLDVHTAKQGEQLYQWYNDDEVTSNWKLIPESIIASTEFNELNEHTVVFSNPVHDEIKFFNLDLLHNSSISISNSLGVHVMSYEAVYGDVLDVGGLDPGVYMITVKNENTFFKTSFIKI